MVQMLNQICKWEDLSQGPSTTGIRYGGTCLGLGAETGKYLEPTIQWGQVDKLDSITVMS